ncbi:hypothetical protein IFM89_002723 [Coptis chinensis]|uniref:Peroxisomal adenine nucleotide carrier 1 n=1 Tax=Coptis chinensis TaxID=261450 RepID=A0A835IJ61_9MAGN|nr:hypothetical protein IFM89_002723 [Coptis chinensis]
MAIDFESLTEATSGAVGSLLSTTILYPLDTCKTKYQAEVRSHGQQRYKKLSDVLWEAISSRQVLSLYQGLGTKNLQSFISSFLYFYGYSYFKRMYVEWNGNKNIGTKANLIIAAAAGACTVIVTHPLDTVSSRMQTSAFGKSKGLLQSFKESTWSEAYDGLGISLLLTSNPSIQPRVTSFLYSAVRAKYKAGNATEDKQIYLGVAGFFASFRVRHCYGPSLDSSKYTAFDQLKRKLLSRKKRSKIGAESSPEELSAFSAFVLGAVSKSIATCLTYPAIRCKVTIQSADPDDGETQEAPRKPPKTIMGAIYTIWRREGLLGFYKGLQAQILKTVLSSALLLMIKEKITRSTWVMMLAIRRYILVTRSRLKSS